LFMDCRDQSFYKVRTIREYFTVMGIMDAPPAERQRILDDYRVDLLIVSTDPIDFKAVSEFLMTGKWICLYADNSSIVAGRSANLPGSVISDAQLKDLSYPDDDTAALSRAMSAYFARKPIDPDLVDYLTHMAQRDPRPNLYTLITAGMDNPAQCLKHETDEFLKSEARRLHGLAERHGPDTGNIIESLERICEILHLNSLKCGRLDEARRYLDLKNGYTSIFETLRREYLGYLW
jgi:hypothetical protein